LLASEAKAAQFALARAAAGRRSDLDSPLEAMAKAWESAMAALVLRYDDDLSRPPRGCCRRAAGAASTPKDLDAHAVTWLPAAVPGTAAGALRAAGSLDGRHVTTTGTTGGSAATFTAPEVDAPYVLNLGGVATLADVWVNGVPPLATVRTCSAPTRSSSGISHR